MKDYLAPYFGKQIGNKDLLLVLAWPVFASVLSIALKVNYFWSIFFFLLVPAAYISYRNQQYIKKIALFSAVISLPLAVVFDYIMEITGSWFTTSTIFPFKLLGYIMIEDIFWLFLWIYFVAIFYESFIDKREKAKLYSPNLKYAGIIGILLIVAFAIAYLFNPVLLNIEFFYLKMSIIAGILPLLITLIKFPGLPNKFIKTGAFFFVHALLYEITALNLNIWSFPAENQFLGFVTMFGVRFPFEELIFWVIIGSLVIMAYYEIFDDDKK